MCACVCVFILFLSLKQAVPNWLAHEIFLIFSSGTRTAGPFWPLSAAGSGLIFSCFLLLALNSGATDTHTHGMVGTKTSRKRNLNLVTRTHTSTETNENVALHFPDPRGTEFSSLPDFATQFSLPPSVNFLPYLESHKTSNF